MTLILFILILGATVLVHEFGHYIFARITGVHVYEFAIGMGPKIFSKESKKTGICYSLRAIPIGGFVQLAGEEVETKEVRKKYAGKMLQDKTVFQRFLIMFFGAGNNFIFALIICFVLAIFFGTNPYKPIIDVPNEGDPMYVAGLRTGDLITKIGNDKVKYFDDARLLVTVHCNDQIKRIDKGKDITGLKFTVKRDGKYSTYTVVPNILEKEGVKSCLYGFSINQDKKPGIIPYSFATFTKYFKQMFLTLKLLFTGKAGVKDLSGPVGIYNVVGQARKFGVASLLELVVLLNVNVGFINLLPFPAFDGGHLLFLIIEKIKGSPVDPKVENTIHTIGFVLLILLIIYVTFNDILRIFVKNH